jgi:hypothetical protein
LIKEEVDVDAEDFVQISSPTKDSSLGRREIESVIFHIISTLQKEKNMMFSVNM